MIEIASDVTSNSLRGPSGEMRVAVIGLKAASESP